MEDPIEHLTKSAQDIRLTREASERIRARLVVHMQEHPVTVQPVRSPYHRFFIQSPFTALMRKPVLALALILLVGAGGATSYGAAGALPGEPLYTVKVNVIEPVTGFLALSRESRAAWKVSVAETRVKEAEQLAAKDTLTPEQGVKVKEGFDQSFGEARATIAKLKDENPVAASKLDDSLTASLDAHEAALSVFATTTATTSSVTAKEASSFADHIKNKVHGKVQGDSDEKEDKGKGSDEGLNLATTTPTRVESGTSSDAIPTEDHVETKGERKGFLRALGL